MERNVTLSMYEASIPVLDRSLANLSAILKKGVAYAEERKFDPAVLVSARLAPDMRPLSSQVQFASDSAKGCAARLAGVPVPSFPDTETTFAELEERIAKTRSFLKTVGAAQVDGSESREIVLKFGPREVTFTGRDYLFGFVLPNFYFHVTTAYDILRHNGVPLGKMDFLGG
jgi:hypothetical protein